MAMNGMKVVLKTGKWLLGILAPIILTALITGQPLTGLVKLGGLYAIFIKSSVPAWAFTLILLTAVFGTYYTLTHLPKRRRKGTVHFIPDAHNCGWSKQTNTEMNVRLGGTLTYDDPSALLVLQAYLEGTQPLTDLTVQTEDDRARPITESELLLRGQLSEKVFMHMRLRPLLGKPGKPLRRKLILRDKYNREFSVGPIEFPYVGPKV